MLALLGQSALRASGLDLIQPLVDELEKTCGESALVGAEKLSFSFSWKYKLAFLEFFTGYSLKVFHCFLPVSNKYASGSPVLPSPAPLRKWLKNFNSISLW